MNTKELIKWIKQIIKFSKKFIYQVRSNNLLIYELKEILKPIQFFGSSNTIFFKIYDIMLNDGFVCSFYINKTHFIFNYTDIDQCIQSMKILRIVKSNNINYDAYISFVIDDYEYWGVVEDLMSLSPELTSEVFKDFDLYQSKEWVIKIKGLIIKTIKTWLKPEPGSYKLLNDEVICYSTETGKQLRMEKGIEVEVVRAHDSKIIIKHDSDYYNLVGDNYVYFNWWFEKLDK